MSQIIPSNVNIQLSLTKPMNMHAFTTLKCFLLSISLLLLNTGAWAQNVSATWGANGNSAWYTPGNWAGGSYAGLGGAAGSNTNIATFTSAFTATTVGINMGTNSLNLGAVSLDNTRVTATNIGNSSGTAGVLRLYGANVTAANQVVRNSGTALLTLQATQTGTMGVVLSNTTDNIFQIDGTGGITVSSIVSELAAGNKLTKNGIGTGVLTLSGANTYTGVTTVNGGQLTLSGSIPSTNSVVVNSGGTLLISSARTLANVTVNTGGTLIVSATLTVTGTATINGTFQINNGGFATGGTWTYGAGATLTYNHTGSTYGPINAGHSYWPASNSPTNVTVQGSTGQINLGVSRTVSGIFQTVAGVTLSSGAVLTLNGTCRINSGGFFNQSPTYGSSSTLIYTSNFGIGNEWTGGGNTNPTAGLGIPANVTIQGGTMTLGTTSRGTPGNLTVNTGAGLTFNGTSGDMYLGGNFSMNGTLNHSGRNFYFVQGNAQSISSTNASVTFNALTINKTGGTTLTLAKPITVNNTLTFTAGFIDIVTFDLTIGSAATPSSASFVKTTNSGQLKQVVAGSAKIFPVGTSAYNPITLTNSGTSDTYGIIELDGTVPNANIAAETVNRRWQVTEAAAGGGNLAVVAQYNSGEEGINYNAGVTPRLGLYVSSSWAQVPATLAGAGPFTSSSTANFTTTITGTSYFAIGKDFGLGVVTSPATVSSFAPASGYSGTTVVIQGTNFTGATAVSFGGGAAASFVIDSPTQITAIVGPTGANGSVAVTNSGGPGSFAGFTYLGLITTTGATDWNTPASWLGGAVPPANSTVTIADNLNIAANVVGNMSLVTINNSISLTWTAAATLNIAAAGTLTNNGTLTAGSGTVNFIGAGTVNGTSSTTFNNLTMNTGALTLGTGSRVDGNFTINGGNIDPLGAMPIYGPASTLLYSIYYGRYREWDAVGIGTIGVTPGYPNNVRYNVGGDIKNNSTLARAINGLMTVSGGTVLMQDINAIVTFGGGLTISSGATFNNGTTNAALNITGNVSVTGAWQFNNMLAATNVSGNVTVNTGGNVNMGGTNSGLFVSGDVTIASGTNFSMSGVIGGDLYVGGNLTNNGVNFTPNTRSVFFTGTAQTISGGFNNSSGNNGFDYIRINNGTTVTLAAAINIRTNLTFNSGKIALSNFDLTLNSAATISTPTSANYVQTTGTGQLRQTVTTAKLFPVGNSAYDPITLTNTGTSDVYGIRVGDAAPAAANDALKAINRTWFVTENTAGGSNLSVVVAQYNSGEVGGSFNAGTQPVMGLFNATTWTIVNTTLAGAGPFTATSSGAAQFPATIPAGSYFGVGKDNAFGSSPSNYFRSVSTGPWTTSATWESSIDNSNWFAATSGPGTGSTVTVQSPNNVTFSGSSVIPVTITIDNGATLTLSNSGKLGSSASTVNVNGNLVAPATIVSAANGMTAQTMTISGTGAFTNSAGTANAITVTNFTVQNSGTYTHDAVGSIGAGVSADFPGTTRTFGASSNVVVKKWANGSTPSGTLPNSMGNVTLDIASLAGSWNLSAPITSIQGNLTVMATGGVGVEIQFPGNTAITGNLSVTGGTLSNILSVGGTSAIGSSGKISFPSVGTRTFSGDVTLDGNWDNTANAAISYGAGLNVNSGSTFTVGTGIQTFTGTATIAGTFPTAVTIPNISLPSGANITNARTAGLTISNSFGAGTGTLIQGTNAVLNYQAATAITPTLDATASGNTVNYDAASSNVKGTSYQNLNLPSGGNYVLGGDVTVGTDVNLNSTSKVRTNANTLIMSPGATLSGIGSSSYVWGNLQKNVSTGSPVRTFEVGDASSYTPFTLTFTGVSVAGDLTASSATPISATPGGLLLNKTISANRFWTLGSVNTLSFTSYVGTFNFDSGDLIGGALNADLKGAIHDGSVWNYPAVSGLAGNSATVNNATVLGTVVFAICIPPTAYTLSGTNSGAYCTGGSGSTLALSGSQLGADYQLQIGGVDVGLPVAGTGASFSFGDFTANGAYTVLATTGQTGCFNTMAGTINVVTNPLPTLGGVSQLAPVCTGISATIKLTGLLLSSNLTIAYSINGIPQTNVAVSSDGLGEATFNQAVTYADNGLALAVTDITNTSLTPNCAQNFVASNTVVLSVHPRPTVSISANDFVCENQNAPIDFYFTGTGNWTLNYKINSVAQAPVTTAANPYLTTFVNALTARNYEITSLSDANCTAIASGLDSFTIDVPIPCSITWNGSANDGDWNNPTNWTPNNAAPSTKTSVVIPGGVPQPNINTNSPAPVCAGLAITGTAIPNIGAGFQLDVRGDLYGSGAPYFTGPGKVVLVGTGAQTVTGTMRLNHVEFANTSGGGVVVAPGATLKIEPNGVATFLANSKLTTNGKFLLASNASGTGKIGPIPTSAIISGPVTQQRYVPFNPGADGGWYFIGSPVNGQNFTDWVDNFKVTGLSTGFGVQGGGIVNSAEPERSSIFKYVEADHNLRVDTVQKIGWTIPPNENIIPGNGYRTFINYYSNSTHLFDNTGTINRGTGVNNEFTFPTMTRNEYAGCVPVTFPCTETMWRGWNLLSNPFPCDIDWDVAASWTKPANMSNAWYRWHSSSRGYGVYTTGIYAGTTPVPVNPNLIPSSQAFFVRLAAPGNYTATLSVKESAKSTGISGQFLRSNVSGTGRIRVHMGRPGVTSYGYDAVIRFMDESTDEIDMDYDFANLGGSNYNISVPVSGQEMSIASFAPIAEFKTIPLTTNYNGVEGQFQLRFSEMEVLLTSKTIYLRDNLIGTIHPISAGSGYSYFVSAADGLITNRFELVFGEDAVTRVQAAKTGLGMSIYPNPSLSGKGVVVSISGFNDSKAAFTLVDALGRVVYSTTIRLNTNGAVEFQLNEKLSPGIYTARTTGGSNTLTQKLIIK